MYAYLTGEYNWTIPRPYLTIPVL